MVCTCGTTEEPHAGCSKSPSSKAAGKSKPEAYPLGYVEDFDDPRTKLAGFFSILLAVRWPRVYSSSDGYLDSRNSLHIGAQISETWCHQPERTAFRIRQRCTIEFIDENTVLSRLLKREAGRIFSV